MKIFIYLFLTLAFCVSSIAQNDNQQTSILIINANVFDGQNEKL